MAGAEYRSIFRMNMEIDPKDYNVAQATQTCLAILKDSNDALERGLACSWLIHLVGDIVLVQREMEFWLRGVSELKGGW